MGVVGLSIRMVMFFRGNGSMIKQMDLEYICIEMELFIRAIG